MVMPKMKSVPAEQGPKMNGAPPGFQLSHGPSTVEQIAAASKPRQSLPGIIAEGVSARMTAVEKSACSSSAFTFARRVAFVARTPATTWRSPCRVSVGKGADSVLISLPPAHVRAEKNVHSSSTDLISFATVAAAVPEAPIAPPSAIMPTQAVGSKNDLKLLADIATTSAPLRVSPPSTVRVPAIDNVMQYANSPTAFAVGRVPGGTQHAYPSPAPFLRFPAMNRDQDGLYYACRPSTPFHRFQATGGPHFGVPSTDNPSAIFRTRGMYSFSTSSLYVPAHAPLTDQFASTGSAAGSVVGRTHAAVQHAHHVLVFKGRSQTTIPIEPRNAVSFSDEGDRETSFNVFEPSGFAAVGPAFPESIGKRRKIRKYKSIGDRSAASTYCHICNRCERLGVRHVACGNLTKRMCGKSICTQCFEKVPWPGKVDLATALAKESVWMCPHCLSVCQLVTGRTPTCVYYNRTTAKRRAYTAIWSDNCKPRKYARRGGDGNA